jgi:peptidoglycan/LPS O-acetylase OafA/YrhL
VLLVSTKTLLRISVAALFVVPALRVLCTPLFPNHFPIYFLTPFRADLLCAGAAIAVLWRHQRDLVQRWSWTWFIPVFVGVEFLLLVRGSPVWYTRANTRTSNGAIYSLTLLIAVGLLLGALRGKGPFAALLRWRVLRYLGVISYSMYLVHASAIALAFKWFGHTWKMVLTAAAMTIAYASVAWFGWERRILHRKTLTGKVGTA